LKGEDVHRYEPLEPRYWVILPYQIKDSGDHREAQFVEEHEMEEQYPKTYAYLKEHEDVLRRRDGGKMDHNRWYDLSRPQNLTDFGQEKISTPEISLGSNFTLDKNGFYHTTKVYGLLIKDSVELSNEYLLSILNSNVLWFFLSNTGYTLRGGYFTFKTNYLNPFSIPHTTTANVPDKSNESLFHEAYEEYEAHLDDGAVYPPDFLDELCEVGSVYHEFLSELTINEIKFHEQRKSVNLLLPDYIGNYTSGSTLSEFYHPPRGVANSILSDTAADREKLKVESATVTDEGSKLVLRVTARYKPESPDEHETDQYGYTETDPLPAMEFVGLTDQERALIEAFVPYAIEEGGGFANFCENATKNNSLIDRLEALTLPALDDVADGLERYRETKARAEELDEKIAKTDELIDQIVYELYGLTDEEIEIVEESVER
jgi:hypothetical protein